MRDDLDNLLGSERPIEPSGAFADSVMRAVREEALAPPPIPFPWRRLILGVASAGCVVTATIVAPLLGGEMAPQFVTSLHWLEQTLATSGLLWLAAGGVLSYLSVKLTLRVAG
jgi:hypothetical protein